MAECGRSYPHSGTYNWQWMNQAHIFNAFIGIPVPMITAVNDGRSFHPETWLMSDYIFVSPGTYYVGKHIHGSYCIAADGLNELVGFIVRRNRVKGFFLNGTFIDAQTDIDLGLWHEIVPQELLERARKFARKAILCLEPMYPGMWAHGVRPALPGVGKSVAMLGMVLR